MTARLPTLGTTTGGPLAIDLPRLLQTRLLIQGQSGSGKSYGVRRLLEETHGLAQQIVLDVEDEYSSLRERYEVVLGGPGRDFPVDPRNAAVLGRRLLELGVSAVLSLAELRMDAQHEFVARFLEALINAPRKAQRGVLVVVEEVQRLARQGGGDTDCTQAVIDLMQRGRKRGLGGVVVCQRISDVHKSVVALAGNRLIGSTTLDVDVQRAVHELGFPRQEGAARLRALGAGHFYAFGPALARSVVEVTVGPVRTSHGTGDTTAPPPPAPPNVRALLAKLADLPAAEEPDRDATNPALRVRCDELERELEQVRDQIDETAAAGDRWDAAVEARTHELLDLVNVVREHLVTLATRLAEPLPRQPAQRPAPDAPTLTPTARVGVISDARPLPTRRVAPDTMRAAVALGPVHQRILDAVAALESAGIAAPARVQVALLCRYQNARSGGFSEPLGALFAQDLVTYPGPGRIALTESGRASASAPKKAPTSRDLQQMILSALSGPEQRLLALLLDSYPADLSRDEAASALNYQNPRSGGFSEPLGHLHELGLVTYPARGSVRAADVLFLHRRSTP